MKRNSFRGAWVAGLVLALGLLCGAGSGSVTADTETDIQEPAPMIALTFDDGPHRDTTCTLLDGLVQRGVYVTFFLIGKQIPGNEDIVQRMDDEGHQIGIHTYDHVRLTDLNERDFDAQVEETRALLKDILGRNDFVLRPPFGTVDNRVRSMAECPIILWSVDPEDWSDQNAERVSAQIIQEAKSGSIILLHDIYPESVEAALRVVDTLQGQGVQFVTVNQLFAAQGVELQAGQVYWNGCVP